MEALAYAIIAVMWLAIACHCARRFSGPRAGFLALAAALAVAMIMWPIMLLIEGMDPDQARDALDDDQP